MKVLVADDDKEIVELLSIYLHNEGYEVVKAYDGKEALSKLRTTNDICYGWHAGCKRIEKGIANTDHHVNG